MNLEQAITTAIRYETRVHAVYAEAASSAENAVARRVFQTLRDEELRHIRYLRERLEEWRSSGEINLFDIGGDVGSRTEIESGAARLRATVTGAGNGRGGGGELACLERALEAERETSTFYRRMVDGLDGAARRLFEQFLAIEEGHLAVVQAEIDLVARTGLWFDTTEFKPEAG